MPDVFITLEEAAAFEGITYEAENQYTSAVLVRAIDQALQKATPSE